MRCTVFNGSPRGTGSNSKRLMEHFLEGYHSAGAHPVEIFYLNRTGETDRHLAAFQNAEHVILIFPLYTDAMPGIVKHFIDALEPQLKESSGPSLGFIIQSGFPEPAHSRFVARYLEKLADRLHCRHTGTVIRGGVEGIQIQPPWMTKKLFRHFKELGRQYAMTGQLPDDIIHKLAPREKLSAGMRLFYRIGGLLGMTNMYWNMMLKKHNAYDRRFARPFQKD